VRSGPAWKNTLLIIIYDEHGGCYDHVVPGAAASPGGPTPDGFAFDAFGVRVPAIIVSPYVRAGSIIRAPGSTPFDHTSIFKTLQELLGLSATPLTGRTAAAPSLVGALSSSADNDGPLNIVLASRPADPSSVSQGAVIPPNCMQQSLSKASFLLPTFGADTTLHVRRLAAAQQILPAHSTSAAAGAAAIANMRAFLGK